MTIERTDTEFMSDAIYKSPQEAIRVSVTTYNGELFIDFRVAHKADDGTYIPTQKGFQVPRGSLEKLSQAFDTVRDYVDGEPDGGFCCDN